MIITMKPTKDLIITKSSRIYQKESCVDLVHFFIPQMYEEIDLTPFTVAMYYTTATNDAYTEILVAEESDKEGFLKYTLPVTSKFTASAGTLTLELSLTWLDEESAIQYVLHTKQLSINVETWIDFFAFYPDDSLSKIDQKILELQNETERLKSVADELELTVPDDLIIEEDILHLSKNGQAMSEGVEILVPGDKDDEDQAHDGVIDLDDITFMEL